MSESTADAQPLAAGEENRWLLGFCASRLAFSLIFTTYSGSLALLRQDWQMTASQAGLVQSAWQVGYLTSLFTVGFLADRFGAKRTFFWAGFAATASALVFAALARDFVSGLLLYGLTGLCSGGSYTPGLAIISHRVAPQRRGRAMGYYIAASSLGYAVSLLMTSVLISHGGWRTAFLATALGPAAGVLIGAVVLRGTPNVVNPHPQPAQQGRTGESLLTVVRNRPAMLAIWAYVFHSWELLAMWAWMPAYLSAALTKGGEAALQAASLGAVLSAATFITSMTGSVAGGSLSDRYGRTAIMLLMSIVSLACAFSFGWLLGLPILVLVAIGLVFQFAGIGDSSVFSTALAELVPARFLGAAYSLRSVLGFGAGAISPWVFGLALDWGRGGPLHSDALAWGLAWTTVGMGGLLGPLATLRLRRAPESTRLAGGLR